MATWKEQREWLDEEALAAVDDARAALRACLARLDAAERVVKAADKTQTWESLFDALDAYDALVREQDGGR